MPIPTPVHMAINTHANKWEYQWEAPTYSVTVNYLDSERDSYELRYCLHAVTSLLTLAFDLDIHPFGYPFKKNQRSNRTEWDCYISFSQIVIVGGSGCLCLASVVWVAIIAALLSLLEDNCACTGNWWMSISLLPGRCSWNSTATSVYGVKYGCGQHPWDLCQFWWSGRKIKGK